MLSRLMALPLIAGVFICIYLSWESSDSYAYFIIPQALLLTVIYVLQPQIDWWWYNRNPPELEIKMQQTLAQFFPFYAKLSDSMKARFRKRVALFLFSKEYIGKGVFEEVPDDIQAIIAATVVQLTFGREDYLLPKYERIVIYPFAFPSPQFPKNIHASEIFEEDGVILYAADRLMESIMKPARNFNIGLYEYARVFMDSYPNEDYPDFDEFIWGKLEAIGGISQKATSNFIGLPDPDTQAVGICYFFTSPEKFQQLLPNAYEQYSKIFNLNPLQFEHPIVDQAVVVAEKEKETV